MSKTSELLKNTIVLGFGRFSSQIIGFALLPLYTYHLSPSEYGLVDIATVYITLLVPALTLQLEMASFRFLIDARRDDTERVRVLSNIIAMAFLLALPWIIVFSIAQLLLQITYGWHILLAGVATLFFNL